MFAYLNPRLTERKLTPLRVFSPGVFFVERNFGIGFRAVLLLKRDMFLELQLREIEIRGKIKKFHFCVLFIPYICLDVLVSNAINMYHKKFENFSILLHKAANKTRTLAIT